MTSGGGAYAFCDEEICPGTVFKLSPPTIKGPPWNLSILWSFGGTLTDGVTPFGNVIMDSRGNLYGTTAGGGVYGYGTAFELTPPATSGGNWTESVLWNFTGAPDGAFPAAGLIMDSAGNLYGTTQAGGTYGSELYPIDYLSFIIIPFYLGSGGTAFELSPPSTPGENCTESALWNFGSGSDGANPDASLHMDASSNLFGTTQSGGIYGTVSTSYEPQFYGVDGTAFELSPPSTAGGNWSESVLWNFGNGNDGLNPFAGLIAEPTAISSGRLLAAARIPALHPSIMQARFSKSARCRAQISVTPSNVQFPSIAIGSTSTATITIVNKGTSQLSGAVGKPPVPFGLIGSGNFSLALNARTTITLTFAPTSTTSVTKEVKVTSNATNASSIKLELHGAGNEAP